MPISDSRKNIPRYPLAERLEHLNSQSALFITCLTISKVQFTRTDIINISQLKNLGALDISVGMGEGSDVDDNVVRNWGRRVVESEEGSFANLRVLILRNQPGITAQSFQYLNDFPVLVLFGIQHCGICTRDEPFARSSGWTHEDPHGLLDPLQREIDKAHSWDGPIRSCFEHSAKLAQTDKAVQPPILNFRIGPTSREVLFNTSRILFFRSNELRIQQVAGEFPVAVADNATILTSKKRKLRRSNHTALEDIFDEIRAR